MSHNILLVWRDYYQFMAASIPGPGTRDSSSCSRICIISYFELLQCYICWFMQCISILDCSFFNDRLCGNIPRNIAHCSVVLVLLCITDFVRYLFRKQLNCWCTCHFTYLCCLYVSYCPRTHFVCRQWSNGSFCCT